MNDGKKSRRRRSSSLLYQEPPESIEHISDQAASPNLNAGWVNAKGIFSFLLKSYGRAIAERRTAPQQQETFSSSHRTKF